MLTCASSSDGVVNGSSANIYFVQPEFTRNATVHDRNVRFVKALLSKDEYSNIIFNDDRIIGRLRDRNDRRRLRRKSKQDDDDLGDFPYAGNGDESLQRCNSVLLTTDGYELCPCANHDVLEEELAVPVPSRTGRKSVSDLENRSTIVDKMRTAAQISSRTNWLSEAKSVETVKGGTTTASSCTTDETVTVKEESTGRASNDDGRKKRRCSELVDQLLVNIYGSGSSGGSGRDSASTTRYGCSDFRDTGGDYSTDSSCSLILPRYYAPAKRHSLGNDSDQQQDKYRKWQSALRTRLMCKRVSELKNMADVLQSQVSHAGSLLIRELKRKDFLNGRQEMQCSIVSAILQAKSQKRSEDTKIQFSIKPTPGESGFQQWHSAMVRVAKLPGGIPHEFRKTLWLTLAERHIASKNINWSNVEKTCFNDCTNPDDDELGIQIVKDLHRTGCSLFCGVSGQQNQAVLKRVLLAYARWNKSVGYCQGFNMLAALILEVMDRSEYDSLKVMIYLIEGVLPESYFANSLRGLSVDMAVFRDLLRLKLPVLSRHLEQLQVDSNETGTSYEPPLTNVFTMQWFLTLFCNCLPHSTVLRVWDLIYLEGNPILLKTALAIWDTLSDRILSVNSADEFYSIMGVLTREILEFGLMDSNNLVKAISNIDLHELTELREKYIYNITPWTQVARKGLRLFYSDDDSDDSEDEDKLSESAYNFLRTATRHGSQSIRSISPSLLGPFSTDKERITLDISALKKQYCKMRERQRQAQIIFTAACSNQGIMNSVTPLTTPAMNHLLLGKSKETIDNKTPQIAGRNSIKPSIKEKTESVDSGETVYWENIQEVKRKHKPSIEETSFTVEDINYDGNTDITDDNNSIFTSSVSSNSSSSTELCDEPGDFDSEDTSSNNSLSECVSNSTHCKLVLYNTNSPIEEQDTEENTEVTINPIYETDFNEDIIYPEKCSLDAQLELNNEYHRSYEYKHDDNHCSAQKDKFEKSSESLAQKSSENDMHRLAEGTVQNHLKQELTNNSLENSDNNNNNNNNINNNNNNNNNINNNNNNTNNKMTERCFYAETQRHKKAEDGGNDKILSNELKSSYRSDRYCRNESDNYISISISKDTEMALNKILQENTEILEKIHCDKTRQTQQQLVRTKSSDNYEQKNNQNFSSLSCSDQLNRSNNFATNCVEFPSKYYRRCRNYRENDIFDISFLPILKVEQSVCEHYCDDNNSSGNNFNNNGNGNSNIRIFLSSKSVDSENTNGVISIRKHRLLRMKKVAASLDDLENGTCCTFETKLNDLTRWLSVSVDNSDLADISSNQIDSSDRIPAEKSSVREKNRSDSKNHFATENSNINIGHEELDRNSDIDNCDRYQQRRFTVDDIRTKRHTTMENMKKFKSHQEVVRSDILGNEINDSGKNSKSCKNLKIIDNKCTQKSNITDSLIQASVKKKPLPNRSHIDKIDTTKKGDPISEYVFKKTVLSQCYKSPPSSPTLKFHPFPSRSNIKPPKELGIKLGLYSINNTNNKSDKKY